MAAKQMIKLPSGGLMPLIGFGTWQVKDGVENIVTKAIQSGYRHIDTAHVYKNEQGIGNAIAKLMEDEFIKREDLFIVTKLPSNAHSRDKVAKTLQGCLERLKVSYVDLFLIHSPMATKDNAEEKGVYPSDKSANIVDTWKGMEDAFNMGLTKSIGLSNFNSEQITRILNNCSIKPSNLQVECHVYFQQQDLHKFCQDHDITFTAYSPLGRPGLLNKDGVKEALLMEDKDVIAVGKKHGKTPAQVLLRFLLQLDMVVIPKSSNEGRMKENLQIFDFTLDDDDMLLLRNLDKRHRYVRFDKVPGQTENPEYPFKLPF